MLDFSRMEIINNNLAMKVRIVKKLIEQPMTEYDVIDEIFKDDLWQMNRSEISQRGASYYVYLFFAIEELKAANVITTNEDGLLCPMVQSEL
jgi:hypothetical protein